MVGPFLPAINGDIMPIFACLDHMIQLFLERVIVFFIVHKIDTRSIYNKKRGFLVLEKKVAIRLRKLFYILITKRFFIYFISLSYPVHQNIGRGLKKNNQIRFW